MNKIDRRMFLRNGSAVAATAATFAHCPGSAFSQSFATSAPFPDYKALVCVFLFGGNDSYNMLVPRSNAEYNVYAASRQNLAIPQVALLPINPLTSDGADYGLHPSMAGLQGLFEAGRMAMIGNVGPLLEPTTKADFFNQSVTLPTQLFSHNDQQDQWHSLKGATVSSTGWAGRMADLIRTNVGGQQLATNLSLFGNTLFQSADETVAYVMGNDGPALFAGFGDPANLNDPALSDRERLFIEQRLAYEEVIDANYDSIYARGFAEVQRRALSTVDIVSNALADAPSMNTPFPQTQLGNQMRTVAQMIAVRDTLEMERQIFFVASGGFDTHDDQELNQPGLLSGVSDAITAFYNATVEIGVAGNVTTFTQSDFARTLTSNGDGTDHAWGGIQFAVGDAVLGRDIYGDYPSLAIDGPNDVGGGRLIPTTSSDQYAATIAKWFGIPDADLDIVAPNLVNFSTRDLGFLI